MTPSARGPLLEQPSDARSRRKPRPDRPATAPRKRITGKRSNQLERQRLAENALVLFRGYRLRWPEEHHHMIRMRIAEDLAVAYSTVCSYLRNQEDELLSRRARGRGWSDRDLRAAKDYWRDQHGFDARPIDWNLADLQRLKDPAGRALSGVPRQNMQASAIGCTVLRSVSQVV